MTNQEWLVTISPKECAELLDVSCNICIDGNSKVCGKCTKGIEEWLKSEHEEDGDTHEK